MIDFSKMPCVYWSDVAKISYLQRRIIIYSIMYYEHNESCISDKEYDSMSYQLVELQKKCVKNCDVQKSNVPNKQNIESKAKTQYVVGNSIEETQYFYAMSDFDGTTGFDLYSRLNEKDRKYLTHLAYVIHKKWKEDTAKNERSKRC